MAKNIVARKIGEMSVSYDILFEPLESAKVLWKKPHFSPLSPWGLVMGPGQTFLTRVGSAIYSLGLDLENLP